jgi:hypothetical protein
MERAGCSGGIDGGGRNQIRPFAEAPSQGRWNPAWWNNWLILATGCPISTSGQIEVRLQEGSVIESELAILKNITQAGQDPRDPFKISLMGLSVLTHRKAHANEAVQTAKHLLTLRSG